jgi:N utilization substance protein B
MLSRRNIRVKVMQQLYVMHRDDAAVEDQIIQNYFTSIRNSYSLFLFTLFVIERICRQSLNDEKVRKKKHLPSEEDSKFIPKLNDNNIVENLRSSADYRKACEERNFGELIDKDACYNLYKDFSKSQPYRDYILNGTDSHEIHREILLDLFRFLRTNETFNELLEDRFYNWLDDKSLVSGAVKKSIKTLPTEDSFIEDHLPDDDAVFDFGEQLLRQVILKEDDLQELITPALKNWDYERLAAIDIILLKMALAELLYFPTVPTKVTLNEYVEIAKTYSTLKSKDFVNGLLDRLMKELLQQDKIKKSGRGLKE